MAGMCVILLLGSNLGDRISALTIAEKELTKAIGNVVKRSRIYETAAWGDETLAPFLNRVIEVETSFQPRVVLQQIIKIEGLMGRRRSGRWEPRTIDIDILFYGSEVVQEPDLVIPHPFLHVRRFTLVPLVEIGGSLIHPLLKKSCRQLLEEVTDELTVTEYKEPLAIN